MLQFILFCLPVLAFGQFPGYSDKPHSYNCCNYSSLDKWHSETLDAESLHSYDQLTLNLDLLIENWDTPLQGTAALSIVARETLTEIPFNAQNLAIAAVRVDGVSSGFAYGQDTLKVLWAVAESETVTVSVDYTAFAVSEGFATGYHNAWEHVYTFCEPYGARSWYPCWDQPSDKFSHTTVRANIPENWSLASNGLLTGFEPHEPGRRLEIYQHDRPISTYLVMISAGNFSRQIFQEDGVQYRYFAWPRSDSGKAAYDWERTPEMVAHFSNLFGDYPFNEYGMVMADIFGGWGAMEHQTFTTYGYHLVDSLRTFEGIVAHELAHQWFGDHLSPVDFRNMWLNEGFATYCNAMWTEFASGEGAFNTDMRNAAGFCFEEERNFPSYSTYNPPPDRLFGANVYFKGAWVLHMLRKQLLGDSLFFVVLQDYVSTFGGGNVDTEDFMNVVNEHYAGPDLTWFFDQWVYGLGYPAVSFAYHLGGGAEEFLEGRIDQHQSTGGYFRFPVVIEHGNNTFSERDTFWIDPEEQTSFVIDPISTVARLAFDQITLLEDVTAGSPEPPSELPAEFTVLPAYPNPFNPNVNIPLSLSRNSGVELKLFDITGRTVASIFKGDLGAGEHLLTFQAPSTMAAGVYLVHASNGEQSKSQKILLLK